MNIPDNAPITNLHHDPSRQISPELEILQLLALGEQESACGEGSPSSKVLAEAAARLASRGL